MFDDNALRFVETADLGLAPGVPESGLETAGLDLDKLSSGIVSGNTLIDFSAAPSEQVRSRVSLALLFASRVADAARKDGDDEDDWLADYTTNLGKLGFSITQSAPVDSRFKKQGLYVHRAFIPFLTIALGGAAVGPIILAALNNLGEMNKNDRWLTLFDSHSRRFSAREMHFAAVSTDQMQTSIRHVVARLNVDEDQTHVLFFKITSTSASFESTTTTMSANNGLLAVVEPQLRQRLEGDIASFIAAVTI